VNPRLDSPVQPVFERADGPVPHAFREQFLLSADASHEILLKGEMHRIWHPLFLHPLFWLLGKFGMLVPIRAERVPATLHVIPGRRADESPFHEWNRTFLLPSPVRFDTTIVWDRRHDDLADLVGRPRLLRMVWAARYAPPGVFTLKSIANAITIGKRVIWLPGWFWRFFLGTVDFRQEALPGDGNRVTVDLRILHPLFRTVFHYAGTFQVVRIAKGS
jgi:hypothetical protein